MGYSKKIQAEVVKESEAKKWIIAGLSMRLKSISTKHKDSEEDDQERSTTPTNRFSRIPETLACPPPPRKRRPTATSSSFNHNGAIEFFNPPDLETVFIRRS